MKGETRAVIPVRCPSCQSEAVIKGGKTDTGNQRSRCPHPACAQQSVWLAAASPGRTPPEQTAGDRDAPQRERGASHGAGIMDGVATPRTPGGRQSMKLWSRGNEEPHKGVGCRLALALEPQGDPNWAVRRGIEAVGRSAGEGGCPLE